MTELGLDEHTLRFIEGRLAALKAMESELNGALSLLLAQHGLTGRWNLDLPQRRLVREEETLSAAA